jgi:hypothetical protein
MSREPGKNTAAPKEGTQDSEPERYDTPPGGQWRVFSAGEEWIPAPISDEELRRIGAIALNVMSAPVHFSRSGDGREVALQHPEFRLSDSMEAEPLARLRNKALAFLRRVLKQVR